MANGLGLEKRPCRPYFGLGTAELVLEYFRIAHRCGRAQLLAAGIGKLDQFAQRAFGYTDRESAVQHRQQLQRSAVERSRLARTDGGDIEEIRFQPTLISADPTGDFEQAKRRALELAQRHGQV